MAPFDGYGLSSVRGTVASNPVSLSLIFNIKTGIKMAGVKFNGSLCYKTGVLDRSTLRLWPERISSHASASALPRYPMAPSS